MNLTQSLLKQELAQNIFSSNKNNSNNQNYSNSTVWMLVGDL